MPESTRIVTAMACSIQEWLLWIYHYFQPTPMDWLNLFIGLVALIMAVPSILQMFYGTPKVKMNFTSDEDDSHEILVCQLVNTPVTGFLNRIGVTRNTIDHLAGVFGIEGNNLQCANYPVTLRMPNTPPIRPGRLPASITPSFFVVLTAEKRVNGKVIIGALEDEYNIFNEPMALRTGDIHLRHR